MKTKLIALAGALGLLAAGVAYAGIPGANGTISACRDNKGLLRVIDAEAGATCGGNQQLLTWNQQGPPGPSGYAPIQVAGDAAGTLVARVHGVRLEMAGNAAALRLRNQSTGIADYACTGINGDSGEAIVRYGHVQPATTVTAVANAEDPALLTCHLVDGATDETAQVFLSRGQDHLYVGHVISDSEQ